MTPTYLCQRVIVERLSILNQMIRQVQRLPLHDEGSFFADSRNVHTAESCMRRALESLFDIGRHMLSKGYGIPAGIYRDVARLLAEQGILDEGEGKLLQQMAGYRNRLTHFYNEVSAAELYRICTENLDDLTKIRAAFQRWIRDNPNKIDHPLTDADGSG